MPGSYAAKGERTCLKITHNSVWDPKNDPQSCVHTGRRKFIMPPKASKSSGHLEAELGGNPQAKSNYLSDRWASGLKSKMG